MVVWLQGRVIETAVVLDFVLKALETEVSICQLEPSLFRWTLLSALVGATRFGDR